MGARCARNRQCAAVGIDCQFVQRIDLEILHQGVVGPVSQISGIVVRVTELFIEPVGVSRQFVSLVARQLPRGVIRVIGIIRVRRSTNRLNPLISYVIAITGVINAGSTGSVQPARFHPPV